VAPRAQNRTVRTQAAWDLIRRRKLTHWAEQYARHGAEPALRAADDLYAHMRSLRPDWPEPELRREDWQQHIKMRTLFDRAAHALIRISSRPTSR
jgi:hypothetical protein